jgi:hypothetical protein
VSSLVLTPVRRLCGVSVAKSSPTLLGNFDSQAKAEKWVREHEWLTKQSQERDAEQPTDEGRGAGDSG